MQVRTVSEATKTRAMNIYYTPQNIIKRKLRSWLGIQQELEEIHKDLTRIMIKQMDMQEAFEAAGWMSDVTNTTAGDAV